MARPRASLNIEQLYQLMRMKPTLADTAAFFEVSEDTIERFIDRKTGLTFKVFREQHMVHCRHSLIRKAYEMALDGDRSMLALCLKHMCGWNDKAMADNDIKPITLAYNIHDISNCV